MYTIKFCGKKFYANVEFNFSLFVRDKYPIPIVIQEDYFRLIVDRRNTTIIKQNQRLALADYEDTLRQYVIRALMDRLRCLATQGKMIL